MSKFRKRFEQKGNSRFSNVPTILTWELFDMHIKYKADTFPKKVNLVSGVFYVNHNARLTMPLAKTAGRAIACDETLDKEVNRLETLGLQSFTFAATKLLLGYENIAIIEDRCFGVQSVGTSGAFCLGARFLNRLLGYNTYYVSGPNKQDHNVPFDQNGFTMSGTYRYFNALTNKVDMDTFLEDLSNAPQNAVIVLQMVGHNPTGCDLTHEQWKSVADVMEEKKLFPFFDCVYQGIGSGDIDVDAYPVRYFVKRGFEMFCAQSFSKNMLLYDEAIGNLLVVLNSPKRVVQVRSQFLLLNSIMYTYPTYYGARIVTYILNNPQYFAEWKTFVKFLSNEIKERRNLLRQSLERMQTPGIWKHISEQVGVFSSCSLTPEECKTMMDEYHIYILSSGRISICGINSSNVEYIAKAIHSVITRSLNVKSAVAINY